MPRSLDTLPARDEDGSVMVVVETPRGSAAKFKFDPDLNAIRLSRPLPAGVVYPHDWGFVPSTCAADGDPLDVMILWEGTSYPGVVVACRLLGLLKVEQTNLGTRGRERNDRLVALPVRAMEAAGIASILDVPSRRRAELERFFLNAVAFEGKDVTLLGWGGPDEAAAALEAAQATAQHAR